MTETVRPTILDEGTSLSTRLDVVNFVGVGVTASRVDGRVNVNIPGGGAGSAAVHFLDFSTAQVAVLGL